MIIVSYDITDNKKRTKFSKFLEQYGERLQYSVFQIKTSKRILDLVTAEVQNRFNKYFDNTDSVFIFSTCEACTKKIIKYGNALHSEKDVVYLE